MRKTLDRMRTAAGIARAGLSRFQHRGVVVWQLGVVCDQAALVAAIDAALDDRRTPAQLADRVRETATRCRVVVVPLRGDDEAPMLATWTRGVLEDVGEVRVGACATTAESVRRGLLALVRRRLGVPDVGERADLRAVS